jgi:GTP-binding protein HflX
VDELVALAVEQECDVIVVDHELTPSQQRNWEQIAGRPVTDRQGVILAIFSRRAQTREARLQVDLARLQYALPRLTRSWTHLGGQGGGIGAKGEGESQLEQDRRRLRVQIDRCRRELLTVRQARSNQRKDRMRTPVPTAAIVGYTNAGKSSLLKRLTGADVLVEDKLFATLDTTTRKVRLPNNRPLLLTDTVGFVRKLPHGLVEAFNATLEESVFSDVLLHVLDASSPDIEAHFRTTREVLGELGADSRPAIVVLNKMDKVDGPDARLRLLRLFPDASLVSVASGSGMPELLERLAALIGERSATRHLCIPAQNGALIAQLHRLADVHESRVTGEFMEIVATVPDRIAADYIAFQVSHSQHDGYISGMDDAAEEFATMPSEEQGGESVIAKTELGGAYCVLSTETVDR